MLAYVFWHRPASGVEPHEYEQTLKRFHRSLARSPPSGLLGSTTLRAERLPWLPDTNGGDGGDVADGGEAADGGDLGGYEDWYLVESWSALGVLERAAVSRGHRTSHDETAQRMKVGTGAIYRRIEGAATPADARLSVWVTRPRGHREPAIATLLEDGAGADAAALWQRALVLGPAPELCLLHSSAELGPGTGVATSRLPAGWTASASGREPLEE